MSHQPQQQQQHHAMERVHRLSGHLMAMPVSSQSCAAAQSTSGQTLEDVVIVSMARTPIGSGPVGGALSSFTAPQLGGIAIREAVKRARIEPSAVEECIFGCVLSAGIGQAPARQAALAAGLSVHTPCTTVNKVCASGMKALMMGSDSIRVGNREIVVIGGMESMSNAPFLLKRGGLRMGDAKVRDGMILDGLTDAYAGCHMGTAAEMSAHKLGITRADQDAYARESYERAQAATKSGAFREEIVPIEVKGKDGKKRVIDADEEVFRAKFDRFPHLRPTFPTTIQGNNSANPPPKGTITAANSSTIGDGASALVLMSASKARSLGLTPLATILSHADAALQPLDYSIAPEAACRAAIKKAGLTSPDQVDLWELNEAFSAVALANQRLLNIPKEKNAVNIFGGGVSLGHPIGSSGARIVCTLISALRHKGKQIGCASLCNGGGGASAVVIKLCN